MGKIETLGVRKRVYWKSGDGVQHGLVLRESGSECEVYNYSTGDTVMLKAKDIEKTITEEID